MLLFSRPVEQVATLPFVPIDDGFEVLLIPAGGGGRWRLPKGWPPGGRDRVQTARREAEEEAGVVGRLHETP
ncbi:MAG: NUDIX domain-containing protein, partial [Rhodospirillaceae bacterium]|nr:NUDIX domain-containing protein [Rhodospirillaceae bacterium]